MFKKLTAGINVLLAFAAAAAVAVCLLFILAVAAVWEKSRKPVSGLARFFQKTFGVLLAAVLKYFCSLEIKGRANLRRLKKGKKPILFISNHQGLLDPMVLVLAVPWRLRPVKFLASTWIFSDKIMGKLAEATGGMEMPLIPKPETMTAEEKKQRRLALMESVIKILAENGAAGVFPQGEITNPSLGVKGNVKVGVAHLLRLPEMENLVVVPMAVSGTWELLCKVRYGLAFDKKSAVDFVLRRRKIRANIGEPFVLADVDCPEVADEEEKIKAMSKKIAEKIEALL